MKMFNFLLLVLLLQTSSATLATQGGHSGNGGGLSEINIVEAWKNISITFEKLHTTFRANFNSEEIRYLKHLSDQQKFEKENLIFKSSSKEPTFFEKNTEGEYKRFKTNNYSGAQIFLNMDKLEVSELRHNRSYNSLESIQLLIEILSYHHPSFTINTKKLSNKLSVLYSDKYRFLNHKEYFRSDIGIEVFTLNLSNVYITSENNKVNITSLINNELDCIDGSKGSRFTITDIASKGLGTFNQHIDKANVFYHGSIQYYCRSKKYFANFNFITGYNLKTNEEDEKIPFHWYNNKSILTYIDLKNIEVEIFNIAY